MNNIKFYSDPQGPGGASNGLAVFLRHPTAGRDNRGRKKKGWEGVIANTQAAGDGPYRADRVSTAYLTRCREIAETQAREQFPALIKLLEGCREMWE